MGQDITFQHASKFSKGCIPIDLHSPMFVFILNKSGTMTYDPDYSFVRIFSLIVGNVHLLGLSTAGIILSSVYRYQPKEQIKKRLLVLL